MCYGYHVAPQIRNPTTNLQPTLYNQPSATNLRPAYNQPTTNLHNQPRTNLHNQPTTNLLQPTYKNQPTSIANFNQPTPSYNLFQPNLLQPTYYNQSTSNYKESTTILVELQLTLYASNVYRPTSDNQLVEPCCLKVPVYDYKRTYFDYKKSTTSIILIFVKI